MFLRFMGRNLFESPQKILTEDMKNDPMVKDKKILPLSGYSAVPAAIVRVCMILPTIVVALVPALIVTLSIGKIANLLTSKSKVSADEREQEVLANIPVVENEKREYDIVLFGSTGFTGRLAALYVAKTYGSSIRWAICGRRKSALEDLRTELVGMNATLKPDDIAILIADSTDYPSLSKMVSSTKVVCTTAGPFDKYGSDLVKCCAEHGTHYCDITGETDWVRQMIDRFDDKAKKTGARIVHFCGHDCVPWDLAVLECSNQLKKQGQALMEVHCYDEICAEASGGTYATVFHSLANRVKYESKLGFDPLLKTTAEDCCNDQGGMSTSSFSVNNQTTLGFASEFKGGSWVGPFVMASVMANCVRRSFVLNKYSAKMTYREFAVYPSFMAGVITLIDMLLIGLCIFIPPLKWLLLETGFIPKPGQGPTTASMDKGFLKVTAFGTGDAGGKTKVEFYFPTDPGYRDTARMLVESGLVLALQINDVKVPGGVYTPAACQGELLTQRLLDTGSSLQVS